MAFTQHFRNIFYTFSGDIGSRVVGFAATAYLARILDTSGFGVIHIGLAVLTYAAIIGNSGLGLLGTKKISAGESHIEHITGGIIKTRLILSSAAFVIGAIIVHLFVTSQEIGLIILIYLIYLFPAAAFLDWFFTGKLKMKIVASAQFVGVLCYLAFLLLFVRNTQHIFLIAWGWVTGGVAHAILVWLIYKRSHYPVKFTGTNPNSRTLLVEAFPLGIASLISQVVIQFPVIFLGMFATTEEAGVYSAAFKMIALFLIFDRVFHTVFFPNITRSARQSIKQLEEHINFILKWVSATSISISLLAILAAHLIIPLVFGSSYVDSIPLFQLLTGYFILTLLNSVGGFALIGLGQEKRFTQALSAGMIVFFISIFGLKFFFGSIGVVIAILLFETTSLIFILNWLKDHVTLHLTRSLFLPLAGSFLIILPLFLLFDIILPLKLFFATFVGIPLIARMAGISKKDIVQLKRMFI